MKIQDTVCYSHLLWAMSKPMFTQAVNSVKFTKPDITSAHMAGYIETKIEIDVLDIKVFSEVWTKWYILDQDIKNVYINLALKGECN